MRGDARGETPLAEAEAAGFCDIIHKPDRSRRLLKALRIGLKLMVFSQKLVSRYEELKEAVPDCLLLMQVGVFMQVMDEDARAVSQVTGLKLQMAGEVDAPVVLGGFPKSGLDAYVGKLVRAGRS